MSQQQTSPKSRRSFGGHCILASLAMGMITATLNVRAEPAPPSPHYSVAMDVKGDQSSPLTFYAVAMTLDANGAQSAPRILTRAGEPFAVASGDWRLEMVVRPGQTPGEAWVAGKLFKGANLVSAPKLLTRYHQKATIQAGDSDKQIILSMVVSPQSEPAPTH